MHHAQNTYAPARPPTALLTSRCRMRRECRKARPRATSSAYCRPLRRVGRESKGVSKQHCLALHASALTPGVPLPSHTHPFTAPRPPPRPPHQFSHVTPPARCSESNSDPPGTYSITSRISVGSMQAPGKGGCLEAREAARQMKVSNGWGSAHQRKQPAPTHTSQPLLCPHRKNAPGTRGRTAAGWQPRPPAAASASCFPLPQR